MVDEQREWQRTGRKKNPLSKVEWQRAGLTTHSTGARVSLAFIVNLDGFEVLRAPG